MWSLATWGRGARPPHRERLGRDESIVPVYLRDRTLLHFTRELVSKPHQQTLGNATAESSKCAAPAPGKLRPLGLQRLTRDFFRH